jgi:hypothetical protein
MCCKDERFFQKQKEMSALVFVFGCRQAKLSSLDMALSLEVSSADFRGAGLASNTTFLYTMLWFLSALLCGHWQLGYQDSWRAVSISRQCNSEALVFWQESLSTPHRSLLASV